MKISILEGYENGFSNKDNSVSLLINTGKLLNQHLKKVVKEVDDIYKIMSDLTKKHEYIDFYHTFRLGHDDEERLMRVTHGKGVLYKTSNKIRADANNLQQQLKNSLNNCCKMLENLGEFGWNGVHFINIKMKDNDVIVKVEKDERRKIKTSHKKTNHI